LPQQINSSAASLCPENARLIVVSFEGPDPYSQAGGLGVRVSGLVQALADVDYETHLFFIGDPSLPGEEVTHDGQLVLHRWAQWISANCPRGVYDGEAGKVADVTTSLPSYLVDHILVPTIAAGRIPILLFEEWQTAECACRVSNALAAIGMRDRAIIVWNANNPYGFERIDWLALASAARITTISRHMRSIIRSCGADARVIPNGIPGASFEPIAREGVAQIRAAFDAGPGPGFLFKMARWEREKGWTQALDAISHTRAHDRTRASGDDRAPTLIARSGGPTGRGTGLADDAAARGLRVVCFDSEQDFVAGLSESVRSAADVVSLRFGVTSSLARTLFAASDGVLANSVSEPFGLVGLEAMAAGGIAFTGGTGEDYAVGGHNAVVLETLDPTEIVARWKELASSPELAARLRRAARKTAREYEWRTVVAILMQSLTHQAQRQGLLSSPPPMARPQVVPSQSSRRRKTHEHDDRARADRIAV
jgi:glycosyltransferase involved in cell wall biosynthesis